jgi:long-chain acyl-CoA synthetase
LRIVIIYIIYRLTNYRQQGEIAVKKYNENLIVGTSQKNAHLYPDKTYLVSRYDYQGRRTDKIYSYTWIEADSIIWDITAGLYALGFREFDRSAVFAPNRPRWVFSAMAPLFLRGAMVPIYPTSKPEDVWWILFDSGAKFCFCGSKEHVERVLEVKERLESLEKIIIMDPLEERPDSSVMGFDEFLELGRKNRDKRPEIEKKLENFEEDDMVALMYTSGTTGRPKGVMLTNRNIVSQRTVISELGFRQDDIWMGHLPLCHSYGFSADLMGASYVPGVLAMVDSLEAAEIQWGLQTFKPTVMNSVPRLWERIFIQINALLKQRPPFVQKYFHWGSSVGRKVYLLENDKKKVPFSLKFKLALARPLFYVIKKKAGLTRLRFCSTGGAAISPQLIVFFGGLGIKLYQGYGLTETSPIINANTLACNKVGTVGKPLKGVEEKIAGDGEILVRGPQVMKGYWNNPDANKEAFTGDGFYRTGDIGFIDEEGYLTITDRKKELLKTSGGKYVAPQPIENAFNTEPLIEQVVVVGENRKYISALVVPEFEALSEWARQKGIEYRDRSELVRHPEVNKLVQGIIDKINSGLARYEQIKKYVITEHPFTEEGGELTPSQKIKRRVVEKKYKDLIDSLYREEVG